jgi:cyclase
MAYGGGVTTFEQVKRILSLGFEKIVFNAASFDRPHVLYRSVAAFGAQAVTACLDVKRTLLGRYELHPLGRAQTARALLDHVRQVEKLGAARSW